MSEHCRAGSKWETLRSEVPRSSQLKWGKASRRPVPRTPGLCLGTAPQPHNGGIVCWEREQAAGGCAQKPQRF